MKQMGVYGLAIPEPYGDFAVSARCYALVTEEIARGWMSLAGAFGGHSVVSKLILRFGTEEQRQRYLPRMATGELRATMALTEPDGGSDLQAMRTVAMTGRRRVRDQRLEDVDHQRPHVGLGRLAVQDRSVGTARPHGDLDPARREGPGLHRLT